MKIFGNCICCGKSGELNILLSVGPHGDPKNVLPRWYLPNDAARESFGESPDFLEVDFCSSCMRKIEDNLRATILYLQSENKLITPVPNDEEFKDYSYYEEKL